MLVVIALHVKQSLLTLHFQWCTLSLIHTHIDGVHVCRPKRSNKGRDAKQRSGGASSHTIDRLAQCISATLSPSCTAAAGTQANKLLSESEDALELCIRRLPLICFMPMQSGANAIPVWDYACPTSCLLKHVAYK